MFFTNKKALECIYNDFNIGNIIYSYLMATYGTSCASEKITNILMIPNNVFYQSNEPLRLQAVTESGVLLNTEESIVSYSNAVDRIKRVYLLNNDNIETEPVFESHIIDIICASDLILFSCGTQWSSLIPTYITKDFISIIDSVPCQKFLIMNLSNDKDVLGYVGKDYIELLQRFLPLKNITIVYAKESIIDIPYKYLEKYNYIICEDSVQNKKYNGKNVITQILCNYYKDKLVYTSYIFDYDYTLYSSHKLELSNLIEKELYEVQYNKFILSANTYSNIHIKDASIPIIANHGSILYPTERVLEENSILTYDDKHSLYEILHDISSQLLRINNGIQYIIEDRKVSVSLKPIYDRDSLIAILTSKIDNRFKVMKTGKTTIEILYTPTSKYTGYKYITDTNPTDSHLYISDDDDIPTASHKYIIDTMEDVYIFLKILNLRTRFLPDLIIVAGGVNSRMNNSTPKLKMDICGETCIERIRRLTTNYVRKIYIFTNTVYANQYKTDNCSVVICTPTDRDIPNGNLETFYLGISQVDEMITDSCIVMWGDCVPRDSRIFAEISCKQGSFVIPTQLEENPYAYIHSNIFPYIDKIMFRKSDPISIGYHDMSIFKIQKSKLLRQIELQYMTNTSDEKHLFDILPYLHSCGVFYETKYDTLSFNTHDEYVNICRLLR